MQYQITTLSQQSQLKTYISKQQQYSIQNSQITIDKVLLNQKQNLLSHYYTINQQNVIQRMKVIKKWPNQTLKQVIRNMESGVKSNNAWYYGNLSNQVFHGYGLLIYQQGNSNQHKMIDSNTHSNIHSNNHSNSHSNSNSNIKQKQKSKNNIRFYQGDFQNNCKHGYGLQYIYGDIYIGKFINNKPQDINALFLWKNGDMYIGSFINGVKHGLGKWQSGNQYYEGMWKLNKPQGNGKIHTQISDYQGQVKNGYKHGNGIQLFTNGDQYDGYYCNGKPQGNGIYKWNNGAIYKGEFKNGIRYGYGIWNYGQESYEGTYINDKRNGEGIYTWGGGSYYKGEFVEDLRHGFGEMHWNQNSFYRGQWKEGHQQGEGQVWENGKKITNGIFQQGKLVKQLAIQKLQKSKATSKTSNNSQKLQLNKIKHNKHYNSSKPNTLLKQKNKQQNSHSHNNSHSHSHSNNKQQQKLKYPSIDSKHKHRINSFHQKLTQIDQFPKVSNKNNNKYAINHSFADHRNPSGHSSASNNLANNNHKNQVEGIEKQRNNLNHVLKRNYFIIETPVKDINEKQKNSQTSSKLMSHFKKKMHPISKTASKSVDVSINAIDAELEPIKWKNFTYVKNHGLQMNSKLTHLKN